METEGSTCGGGAKIAPQSRNRRESRGAVTGAAEGQRAEAGEAEEEASGSGGRGADEAGTEGQDDPRKAS